MAVVEVSAWLTVVGGTAMNRDAIQMGFVGSESSSIESIATELEAVVTVVFCNSQENQQLLTDLASEQDQYVIAIVPDLDVASFNRVLRHGASGVVWEDTPVAHLADVTRAALHHDILLPAELVRMLTNGEIDPSPSVSDLDPATAEILNALAGGMSMRDIAFRLSYSERTIQRRITNLCLSLGALTPAQAVHLAHKQGLLK